MFRDSAIEETQECKIQICLFSVASSQLYHAGFFSLQL